MADMEEKAKPAPQEECLCRAVWRQVCEVLPGGPSERTREHLRNSRVEFLKAIRSIIDDRIEQIERHGEKGTRVVVE